MKNPEQTTWHRFLLWFMAWQSRRAAETINRVAPTGKILEVGCGFGWLSNGLVKMQRNVVKTDHQPTTPDVLDVDIHDMPFPDQSFDLVVCSNTIEHLKSPQIAIKEMRRVGRRLWLSWTPWWGLFGGHGFAPLHYFGVTKGNGSELGVNLYKTTVAETLRQLNDAGWKVDHIRPRYWPCLGFLARWRWTREWATWNVEIVCST